MSELLSYALVLAVHISTFIINIALVVISDLHALLWVMGKVSVLPAARMRWLHRIVGLGLLISILSGAYLAAGTIEYLLTVPAFYVKLGLVAALVVNAFVVGAHLPLATTTAFRNLTAAEKRPLFISGVVSTAGWVGVFIAAQFLGL